MAIDYFTDSTERTAATLESDGMRFMGGETGNENPVHVSFAILKAAVLAAVPSSSADYILIRDAKTSGTDGGTFTSGAWQTRQLTEETHDDGGHASLSTNQVTLDAGTYQYSAVAIGFDCGFHQLRLQNITDTTTVEYGLTCGANAANNVTTTATVKGSFTITMSKTFEVQHRCATTRAANGFGDAASFGNSEIYCIFELWKTA